MNDEENISSYFLWVDEVLNYLKELGEKIEETTIVQKLLRSLPLCFHSKVSSIKELKDLEKIKNISLYSHCRSLLSVLLVMGPSPHSNISVDMKAVGANDGGRFSWWFGIWSHIWTMDILFGSCNHLLWLINVNLPCTPASILVFPLGPLHKTFGPSGHYLVFGSAVGALRGFCQIALSSPSSYGKLYFSLGYERIMASWTCLCY